LKKGGRKNEEEGRARTRRTRRMRELKLG